ncbi:hypothetical protein CLF_101751 [Clonorchis sinensis]|uniref:Uncharacterized protein n=1 Tax=Clonorchis sinensis TaxID=79923 RepID=G7Y6H3_CLOSI|nr:hypothetical protein CLF_101751 [Clonorchis sinensis]
MVNQEYPLLRITLKQHGTSVRRPAAPNDRTALHLDGCVTCGLRTKRRHTLIGQIANQSVSRIFSSMLLAPLMEILALPCGTFCDYPIDAETSFQFEKSLIIEIEQKIFQDRDHPFGKVLYIYIFIIIMDNMTSVYSTDASLLYNHDLFESLIVKKRIEGDKVKVFGAVVKRESDVQIAVTESQHHQIRLSQTPKVPVRFRMVKNTSNWRILSSFRLVEVNLPRSNHYKPPTSNYVAWPGYPLSACPHLRESQCPRVHPFVLFDKMRQQNVLHQAADKEHNSCRRIFSNLMSSVLGSGNTRHSKIPFVRRNQTPDQIGNGAVRTLLKSVLVESLDSVNQTDELCDTQHLFPRCDTEDSPRRLIWVARRKTAQLSWLNQATEVYDRCIFRRIFSSMLKSREALCISIDKDNRSLSKFFSSNRATKCTGSIRYRFVH